MARERDPRRDQAFEIWKASNGEKKLTEIAEELGVSPGSVRGWKNKDNWNQKLNGTFRKDKAERSKQQKKRGAPKGNKNAVGNRGGGAPLGNQNGKGHGPPKGNQNAVKTGLFKNFFHDVFDQEELEMLDEIETDPLVQITDTIKLLTLREKFILKKIQSIELGLTSVQKLQIHNRRKTKEKINVEDPLKGGFRVIEKEDYKLVTEQIQEAEESPVETTLKLWDALTKVQKEKVKALKIYHEISSKFELDKELRERRLAIEEEKWQKEKGEGDKQQEEAANWVAALEEVAAKRKKKKTTD